MDENIENPHEICTHDGVMVKKTNSNCSVESNTTGSIHLIHSLSTKELWIEWRPNDGFLISDTDTQEQDEWSFVDTIVRRNRTISESLIFNTNTNNISVKEPPQGQTPAKPRTIRVKLKDLKCVEVLKNGLVIKLIAKADGRLHSEFVFQHGNADNFVRSLSSTHCLQRNHRNRNTYDIVEDHTLPHDSDKLQKTFAELQIDDIKSGSGWITDVMRRPFEHTLDIFAKITDVYVATPTSPPAASPKTTRPPVGQTAASPSSTMMQSTTDDYEVLSTSPRLMGPDADGASGAKPPSESGEKQKLPHIEIQPRGQPLSEMVWRSMINEDGSIPSEKVDLIKEKIYRGGIEDGLRAEVWKYLLDYDLWGNTTTLRDSLRKHKKMEYYTMKSQWLRMTPVQESNFTAFRDRKCQIEKDVKRTDRTQEFFAGDDNPNLETLHEILMTYVMYNFDLGYVQGMSDLLAPILYVMKCEKDAFWCFVGFMDRIFTNFDMDQAGMKRQLGDLTLLLAFANPRLYSYFLETGSDNMYFCFRWMLVWFKREFSQDDTMRLWEVLWTGLPCINYHLFISLAILDGETEAILDAKYNFNEILKHINELSMRLDLDAILAKAEAIYYQVKNAPHLTDEIRGIIGEDPVEKVTEIHTDSDDESDAVISGPTKSVEEEEKLQKKIEEALEQSMYFNFY